MPTNDESQQELTAYLNQLSDKKDQMGKYRPLSRQEVELLNNQIKIDHVWSSNAIEGNKLERYETEAIINEGATVGKHTPVKEILETLDLNEAYDYMTDIASHKQPLTETEVRDLNRIITLQTADVKSDAGAYRSINVHPAGSEFNPYAEPSLIPDKMRNLIDWSHEAQEKLHPVQYAADLHQRFVTIHPFSDGNGRTARLLLNFALTQSGYPVINVQPDRKSRDEYIDALIEAQKPGEGNKRPFERLIANYVNVELDRRIDILKLHEKNIEASKNQSNLKSFKKLGPGLKKNQQDKGLDR